MILLKFQVASYSALDKIDVGIYVVRTGRFQKFMGSHLCAENAQRWGTRSQTWEGSLTFEKVKRYLPHFKSAIQVPICVLGIDV